MDMTALKKVILCKIEAQDRRRRENGKHTSLATILLLFDFDMYIAALESVLQSSFKFFVSIHLLVFGCPL